MPINKHLTSFIFLCFLCCTLVGLAQEVSKRPLLEVIKSIEETHSVRFSYVEEHLMNVEVIEPNNTLSLAEKIDFLNVNTPFIFSKINDRYYSIRKPNVSSSKYCATLIDSQTGLPIENAIIEIVNGTETFSTASNENGVFYIPNSLISGLFSIRHLGFETLQIAGNEFSTNCADILMFPVISTLDEVFITNVLVKGISRSTNGATIINTNSFGLLPGQTETDVLQIVQSVPGVESVNETISTINIRGGSNDENLILWEGIRMYQTGHFFGLISAFNPNLTQKVSLYKNATPAQYGQTVSGVIDMATNNTIANHIQGGIGSNLINANAFVEIPISEKLEVQFSGRSSINSIYESPVYNNFSNRIFQDTEITNVQNSSLSNNIMVEEDFYFFDVGGKLLYNMTERDQIQLNFIVMENHFEFTEQLFDNGETSRLEQKSEAGGISWQRQWNSKFQTTASFSASHYLLDALNQDIFTTQTINQENEILDLSTRLHTQWQLSPKWTTENGYQFIEIGVSNTQDVNLPRFRDYDKNVLRTHAIYSQWKYRSKNRKTRFHFGVRGNYLEKLDEFVFEPRLYAYQELLDGFGIELLGEFKSQSLTQRIDLQSDFLGVEKRRWILADNNQIPLKKSKQVSLGFLYHKKSWFVNVEGYVKRVNNIISKSQGFQNQFQFAREIGDYEVYGVEMTLNKKFNKLSLWSSYHYAVNDYTFESLSPASFPNNFDIRHTVSLASSFEWNHFKFALGLNWRTGKPLTLPLENEPLIPTTEGFQIPYDLPNDGRLSDYLRADFSTQYNWELSEKTEIQFNLALLNISNSKNSLNIRYALADESDPNSEIQKVEEISLGFTPNFSVQFLFY